MIKTKSYLPDDWNIIKLGKFAINEKGKKPKNLSKSKSKKFNIPYIDIQSFEKGIINSWTDGEGIRECFDTDFLMVWDGSRSGLVGKGMNGALGSTLVRINFPKVNNLYAYYFLKSKYYEINKRAKGSGTPHVDPDLLWNYDFPIAPLKTQERIVSFLNDEFKKIALIEENLNISKKKLKYFRQSLMNNAFLGRISGSWRKNNKCGNIDQLLSEIKIEYEAIYLEEKKYLNKYDKKKPKKFIPSDSEELELLQKNLDPIPKQWKWVRVKDISILGTGATPLKSETKYYLNGNIPWLTSGALNKNIIEDCDEYITKEAYDKTNLRLYPPNTLLLAMYGEGKTRGKCSELKIKATTNQAIAAIVMNSTASKLKKYLKFYFQKNYYSLREKASGGVQPNLNLDIIKNTPVPLCSIEEANFIVKELEQKISVIENIHDTLDEQLKKIEYYKFSLLRSIFLGKKIY